MAADFSLNLGAELNRTLAVAAAHCQQSRAAFIREACVKALAALAQSDPALAVHMNAISRHASEVAQ